VVYFHLPNAFLRILLFLEERLGNLGT